MKNLFRIDLNLDKRIFGLDVMRMIAIMLVILLNGDPLVRRNFSWFPRFWHIDGVDLFFVLSGFLIGTILIKTFEKDGFNRPTLFHFWKFRWYRTLPNYYLILLVMIAFVYVSKDSMGGFSWKYFFFLQNFASSMPDFFSVAWSLTVEEWFYISFPLISIGIAKLFPKLKVKQVVLATILIFLFFPLAARFYFAYLAAPDGNFATMFERVNFEKYFRSRMILRLDSIGFGVLGAYIAYYYENIWKQHTWKVFAIGSVIYLFFRMYDFGPLFQSTFRFTICSFAILMFLPLASTVKSGPVRWAAPVTYISMISYSMYLIHRTLIMDGFRIYGGRPFSDLKAIVYYGLYFVLVFGLSALLYKYFELPMMKLRDRGAGKNNKKPASETRKPDHQTINTTGNTNVRMKQGISIPSAGRL
jgi:peptidoglycan/LPS O-acetylase OafA/YrhL